MRLVGAFDPSVGTSGYMDVGANDGDKVLLYNLSVILIQLTFEDGTTAALHPFEANWWQVNGPTPQIKWQQYDILASNANPMSTCTIQVFGNEEEIPGTYPMPLVYLSAISNTVTVSQGSIGLLQNDGNTSTDIIESTLFGSPSSNVLVKNDGTVTIAQYVSSVLTNLLQLIPGASTPIKIGNTGLTTENLGNLKVDGTLATTGAATLNSASITNNETVGGTLGVTGNTSLSTVSTSGAATLNSLSVTGTASFNGNGASIDASSNFNGNATNTNTVNATTVNCTTVNSGSGGVNVNNSGNLVVTGTSSLDNGKITTDGSGHITIPNGVSLKAKNASGTGKTILWLDNLNNTQLQCADGGIIQFDKSDGSTILQISASTGIQASNGADILYFNTSTGELYVQAPGSGKIYFKNSNGTNRASIDSSGNLRCAGTVTGSTTP